MTKTNKNESLQVPKNFLNDLQRILDKLNKNRFNNNYKKISGILIEVKNKCQISKSNFELIEQYLNMTQISESLRKDLNDFYPALKELINSGKIKLLTGDVERLTLPNKLSTSSNDTTDTSQKSEYQQKTLSPSEQKELTKLFNIIHQNFKKKLINGINKKLQEHNKELEDLKNGNTLNFTSINIKPFIQYLIFPSLMGLASYLYSYYYQEDQEDQKLKSFMLTLILYRAIILMYEVHKIQTTQSNINTLTEIKNIIEHNSNEIKNKIEKLSKKNNLTLEKLSSIFFDNFCKGIKDEIKLAKILYHIAQENWNWIEQNDNLITPPLKIILYKEAEQLGSESILNKNIDIILNIDILLQETINAKNEDVSLCNEVRNVQEGIKADNILKPKPKLENLSTIVNIDPISLTKN